MDSPARSDLVRGTQSCAPQLDALSQRIVPRSLQYPRLPLLFAISSSAMESNESLIPLEDPCTFPQVDQVWQQIADRAFY